MGKCNFSDVVLNSVGYIAEFSSQRGATCFRLFHERSGREILRFPKAEETFFENVFLYGNPVLVSAQPHSRRKVFLSRKRVLLPRERAADELSFAW